MDLFARSDLRRQKVSILHQLFVTEILHDVVYLCCSYIL